MINVITIPNNYSYIVIVWQVIMYRNISHDLLNFKVIYFDFAKKKGILSSIANYNRALSL